MPGPYVTPEVPAAELSRRLGNGLRVRRKGLGISMTAAADAAGISRVTWHRLEKGESTVAWGSFLAAAVAVGLDVDLVGPDLPEAELVPTVRDHLPLNIPLSDFPGLRRLAWQVGEKVSALTPREALGMYMRNARHLDVQALPPDEIALIRALEAVFGEDVPGV